MASKQASKVVVQEARHVTGLSESGAVGVSCRGRNPFDLRGNVAGQAFLWSCEGSIMRHVFTLGATAGLVGLALLAAFFNPAPLQGSPKEAVVAAAKGGVEQQFVGVSTKRSFDEALANALGQVDKAMARQEVPDNMATWRVVEISGRSGGIAGLDLLQVKIAAQYQTRADKKAPGR